MKMANWIMLILSALVVLFSFLAKIFVFQIRSKVFILAEPHGVTLSISDQEKLSQWMEPLDSCVTGSFFSGCILSFVLGWIIIKPYSSKKDAGHSVLEPTAPKA
jgi:hypothetical protein